MVGNKRDTSGARNFLRLRRRSRHGRELWQQGQLILRSILIIILLAMIGYGIFRVFSDYGYGRNAENSKDGLYNNKVRGGGGGAHPFFFPFFLPFFSPFSLAKKTAEPSFVKAHTTFDSSMASLMMTEQQNCGVDIVDDDAVARASDNEAVLTTLGLMEEIPFKNERGGVWTQGWELSYNGTEWDEEKKLRVFVVPHSHNDPGWIRTVQAYYKSQTRHILNNIVNALKKDPRRRFIWMETVFLHKWWMESNSARREDLKSLVKTGQLEIIGGGWVMNDEATCSYSAIINQMIEGHQWLLETLEFTPRNYWATDPFGLSTTMAYLLERMGFEHMVAQRVHYEMKKALARKQSLEFRWQQRWASVSGKRNPPILCHIMPFFSYDIPHTCGPDPSVCCQFDFARLPTSSKGHTCPWIPQPEIITEENIHERSELLLDQYRKKSILYRTNNVLVFLGDDFRYDNEEEVDSQFDNYEALFAYMNNQTDWNVNISWGTLSSYFDSVETEVTVRLNHDQVYEDENDDKSMEQSSAFGRRGTKTDIFPVLEGDFFTYSDKDNEYWSGYFTSRPFYKILIRVIEETLRAAEILYSFVRVEDVATNMTTVGNDRLLEKRPSFLRDFHRGLVFARQAVALFQHHDGITGTARRHVVADYSRQLYHALDTLKRFMPMAVELLLRKKQDGMQASSGLPDSSKDLILLRATLTLNNSNALLTEEVVDLQSGLQWRVALFNPLAERVRRVVTLRVCTLAVCVLDEDGRPVETQAMPEWLAGEEAGESDGAQRISWLSDVAPMGIRTYFVRAWDYGVCSPPQLATLELINAPAGFSCPVNYECRTRDLLHDGEDVVIANADVRVNLSSQTGLITSIGLVKDGFNLSVYEDFLAVPSEGGAYLVIPNGPAESVLLGDSGGVMFVLRGPLIQEAYTEPSTYVNDHFLFRTARLYNAGSGAPQSAAVEVEYYLDLKAEKKRSVTEEIAFAADSLFNAGDPSMNSSKPVVNELTDVEFLVRYDTGLRNEQTFFTDSNGLQSIERRWMDKIPLQGNYYPATAYAFLEEDAGVRFTVHTCHAVGVSSLTNGSLDITIDRKLLMDDHRGLEQSLADNLPIRTTFHLLIENRVQGNLSVVLNHNSSSQPLWGQPSLLSHQISTHMNHPFHMFLGRKGEALELFEPAFQSANKTGYESAFTPLLQGFPSDLHVVSLRTMDAQALQNETTDVQTAIILRRYGSDCRYGRLTDDTVTADGASDLFPLPQLYTGGVVALASLFTSLEVQRLQPTLLSLIERPSRSPGVDNTGSSPLVYPSRLDLNESMPRGSAPSEKEQGLTSDGSVKLSPMEVRAFKFHLRRRT